MTSTPLDVPALWCRFCKDLTRQWVDVMDAHDRVCIKCWRRQADGEHIELQDQPSVKPPSLPPPPMLPASCNVFSDGMRDELYFTLRDVVDGLDRRVRALEEKQQQEIQVEHVEGIGSTG